ncbi:MAG: methyltransferase domain-containing protein [Bacteroidetes bacterium]|nr:MAG: methyltransferase domain-containing protein [Bacteroidota bacterium]
MNLRQRSYQKELMDGDDIPFQAMAQTLKELNIVNTRLGGHAITIEGVRQLIKAKDQLVVCEIGCGGGDNLFAVYKYCLKKEIPVRFIGIDMNPECIAFAKQQYPQLPCEWICSDYALADLSGKEPDIIFSSLFCHHFTDAQLVQMLQWLKKNSRSGFFINDLHRHWLAYYLIKYITMFFSRSYLVKNDACLSVARSFRKNEWKDLFRQAGVALHNIRWKWAFRWLVIGKN